jgi:hypothetical protein
MDDSRNFNAYSANPHSCNSYVNAWNAAAVHTSQQHSIDMILGAQRILQNEFEKNFSNCDFLANGLTLNHFSQQDRKGKK